MGLTIFLALDTPPSGGDTLYLSTVAAYNALSPRYRETLHGLEATHSAHEQAKVADHRERYIREPIETIHPVVRTHPVRHLRDHNATVASRHTNTPNPGHQVQVTLCESPLHKTHSRSEGGRKWYVPSLGPTCHQPRLLNFAANILNFLYNHIEHGQDWHIRVHWTPGTVVVYDNRITQQYVFLFQETTYLLGLRLTRLPARLFVISRSARVRLVDTCCVSRLKQSGHTLTQRPKVAYISSWSRLQTVG